MTTIFNLQLTDDDINFIGSLLDEAPYKRVKPLADRLQAQISAQLWAAEEAERVKNEPFTAEPEKNEPAKADAQPDLPDVMDLATGNAALVPAEQGS